MDMAQIVPMGNVDPLTGYGYDAAGNAVCMSPTLVRSGYLNHTDGGAPVDHTFGVIDHQGVPYMVVIDGDDADDNGEADYEPARVAHAPGIGGHYWSAGGAAAGAGALPAPSDGIGRQIAGMLESLAGLDSDVAAAAAAMFAPTATAVDDRAGLLQEGVDAMEPRVSHMRMPGGWGAADAAAVRARLPAARALVRETAPTDTESAGETYTVEGTANIVYYDDNNGDRNRHGRADDGDDADDHEHHYEGRRVAHSQAYAPASARRRHHNHDPAPAQAPASSSSSSSSSSTSSSSTSSSSSFFSGTTFGTSRTTASSPSSSCSSSSSSSSSSWSYDDDDDDDTSSRPQRQRRRRRDPCSPSSGNTVSISSISAPWASAFSTVSTGASSSLSDSTASGRGRRAKRRAAPKRRARHLSTDESSTTDVGEMHRRAKHLVALARTGSAGDETEDGGTVDPHAVASRARHNRR
nr:hypothetical protein [Pandoravirus massiliensis]